MSACRSCQAEILWLANLTTGRRAPIDAQPVPDGNIVVRGGHYQVLAGQQRQDAIGRGVPLHTSHFVGCPQAPAWGRTG